MTEMKKEESMKKEVLEEVKEKTGELSEEELGGISGGTNTAVLGGHVKGRGAHGRDY